MESSSDHGVGVQAIQFPNTASCKNCNTIFDLTKLTNQNKSFFREEILKKRDGSWYCPDCYNKEKNKYTLVPSRFIIATEFGLIDDFPWDWYVHRGEKYRMNRIEGGDGSCSKKMHGKHLELVDKGGALHDMYVKCRVCGARESMGPIFDSENPVLMRPLNYLINRFNKLSAPWKTNFYGSNEGQFHWDYVEIPQDLKELAESRITSDSIEELKKYFPRVLQRGAGNVYFPVNYVGFILPKSFQSISDIEAEDRDENINDLDNFLTAVKGSQNIPKALSAKCEFVLENLTDKLKIYFSIDETKDYDKFMTFLNANTQNSFDQLEQKSDDSRLEEFLCFSNPQTEITKQDWFKNEIFDVDENNYSDLNPFLEKVVLLHKIKQLNIQKGFTRVRPLAFDDLILAQDENEAGNKLEEYLRIQDVRKYPDTTKWLPCSEVKGEGVLLVFDDKKINEWCEGTPGISDLIKNRIKLLSVNYRRNMKQFDSNLTDDDISDVSPRYVLLHTLSHLLINLISKECGYNTASLSEIIYCNRKNQNDPKRTMNAILIYTSTPDAEGSLGGLVQVGAQERLQNIFREAIEGAKWCSSDPICIETKEGQGFMGVNLASCYSCSMLPETSCENMNRFLDRGLIVGTIDEPEIGFFNDLY